MPNLAAPVLSQLAGSFQTSSALLESGYVLRPDSSSMLRSPVTSADVSSWTKNTVQTVNTSPGTKGLVFRYLYFTKINLISSLCMDCH